MENSTKEMFRFDRRNFYWLAVAFDNAEGLLPHRIFLPYQAVQERGLLAVAHEELANLKEANLPKQAGEMELFIRLAEIPGPQCQVA